MPTSCFNAASAASWAVSVATSPLASAVRRATGLMAALAVVLRGWLSAAFIDALAVRVRGVPIFKSNKSTIPFADSKPNSAAAAFSAWLCAFSGSTSALIASS